MILIVVLLGRCINWSRIHGWRYRVVTLCHGRALGMFGFFQPILALIFALEKFYQMIHFVVVE